MRYRATILWGLFAGIIVLSTVYVTRRFTGTSYASILDFASLDMAGKTIIVLATLLLILHAIWTLGALRGIVILVTSSILGFVFEALGINYGVVFGGRYAYEAAFHPGFLGVPLLIPLFWAGFIYTGYTIVSSFSVWLNKKEIGKGKTHALRKLRFAAICAFVVVAIDISMEPLQVSAGNWTWLSNGHYFNIPAGNFMGWFLLAFLSIALFMFLKDYLPQKRENIASNVLLIPIIGYGVLSMIFSIWALKSGMVALALIGLLAMSPVIIINLALFIRWQKLPRTS